MDKDGHEIQSTSASYLMNASLLEVTGVNNDLLESLSVHLEHIPWWALWKHSVDCSYWHSDI